MFKRVICGSALALVVTSIATAQTPADPQPALTEEQMAINRAIESEKLDYERQIKAIYSRFEQAEAQTGYRLSDDAELWGEFLTRMTYFDRALERVYEQESRAEIAEGQAAVNFELMPAKEVKARGLGDERNCALLNSVKPDGDMDPPPAGTKITIGSIPRTSGGWLQCIVAQLIVPEGDPAQGEQMPISMSLHSQPLAAAAGSDDSRPVLTVSRLVPMSELFNAPVFLQDLADLLQTKLVPVGGPDKVIEAAPAEDVQ